MLANAARRRRNKLVGVVVGLALTIGLLEAGAQLLLHYYFHTTTSGISESARDVSAGSQFNWSSATVRPHPFFAYVNSPTVAGSNNMGFESKYEYPYKREPQDYVIGLFGGSVALILGRYLAFPDFFSKFESDLKRAVPALKNRRIVLLNFGMACGKQPQQFAIYSYFLDSLDLSVNLDGFNEIVFNSHHFPIEYPIWTIPLFSRERKYDRIRLEARWLSEFDLTLSRYGSPGTSLSGSAFYLLFWKAAHTRIAAKVDRLEELLSRSDDADVPVIDLGTEDKKDKCFPG